MGNIRSRFVWIVCVAGFCASQDFVSGVQTVDFNRDVRPILVDHCFACHGPDAEARQAELRLDQREIAVERGAIVPGDTDKSLLVDRIMSDDPDVIMPPPEHPRRLEPEQQEILRRWITQGAQFDTHWAWVPPIRPPLPDVENKSWPRNAIDHFVLAELERRGLSPAEEATIEELVRRVTLDINGLPPTPEQVDSVLNDSEPDRFERYVDRLLALPAWGEHRGRYWLDYARYADTHGIHFDNFREIWSYREWVIGAYNRNMPFDEFTIRQLAGDLMPNRGIDELIATGFNRCNITTNEGGAIDEEYQVLYARDRVETTSAVWMGLTSGCATCHDHKYDPMTQKEFYQLAAFFNNTTQRAMDGNVRDTPPIIRIPTADERSRHDELKHVLEAKKGELADLLAAGRDKMEAWINDPANPEMMRWREPESAARLQLHAPLDDGTPSTIDVVARSSLIRLPAFDNAWVSGWTGAHAFLTQEKGHPSIPAAGDFDRESRFTVMMWLKLPENAGNGAVVARMADDREYRGWDIWVENGRVGTHFINSWPESAIKVLAVDSLKPGEWYHVAVAYDGSGKSSGFRIFVDGKLMPLQVLKDGLTGTTRIDVPLKIGSRHAGSVLPGAALNDLRIFDGALELSEIEEWRLLSRGKYVLDPQRVAADSPDGGEHSGIDQAAVRVWMDLFDEQWKSARDQLKAAESEMEMILSRGTVAYIMQEKETPATAFVLFRGEYDQRREEVSPGTPAFLPAWREDFPPNRLGLAQWLLSSDHPLTARVTVNRYWQEVFGRGIVPSSGDFGTTGQNPANQELLDWLAVDFRDHKWDVKRLFRMMVTSATYRQAAKTTTRKLQIDPQNDYLSRGPRFRMDAEMIRDSALAASGLLVEKTGGPSVKPYQPEGVWEAVAMPESNTRAYRADDGESLYRRSMYTFWKRSAPPASMEIMNAPSREYCTVSRERTNTPLQALVLMNDPQMIEAARVMTESILLSLPEGSSIETIGNTMARRLFGRTLCEEELKTVADSQTAFLELYGEDAGLAAALVSVGSMEPQMAASRVTELAAWTMVASQLMNTDEFLNK